MRIWRVLAFYCFGSLLVFPAQAVPPWNLSTVIAQEQTPKAAFEVATIRASAPQPMGTTNTHFSSDGAMVRSSYLSLEDYVRIAYRLRDFQVEAPSWTKGARFNIQAKIPEGLSRENVPEMLQSLLAERFHLTVHHESKELPVIALVALKNGKQLTPSRVSADVGRSISASGGGNGRHIVAKYATLADLAQAISTYSDRPVVDMTNIPGKYDFDLTYSTETSSDAGMSADPSTTISLPDALKQYGLELKARKAPVEVLVVDHIDKVPTEN